MKHLKRILLVEDEHSILNMARLMLKTFGYRVLPASNPGVAMGHNGLLDKGVNFIEKPFSMQDLTAKVRQILEAG